VGSNPILSATFTHTVRSRALRAFYAMNRLILTSVAGADCPDATKNATKVRVGRSGYDQEL
jgi:hypothetical protein